MIADHGSVTDQAVALAKKLKITPEDNPTSKSLKDAQDANRTKLGALSGAAFDKAYADNEAAYHKSVNDALSNFPRCAERGAKVAARERSKNIPRPSA
jgi:putative membrane protein